MSTKTPLSGARVAIVGSGPNGLTAGALLVRQGWQVDVYEASAKPGGAAASADVFDSKVIVDIGAAAHPFGVASPAFRELGLEAHGLRWARSQYPMAHPLDGQPAALLADTLEATAAGLLRDGPVWRTMHRHIVDNIDQHLANFLGPIVRIPPHPIRLTQFAPAGLCPAYSLTRAFFRDEPARALFLGSAAHAIASLRQMFTGAFGLLFGALGMSRGWPVAVGGSGAVTASLMKMIQLNGGRVHCGAHIKDVREIPDADAIILNLTPRQVMEMRGLSLTRNVEKRMQRWNYGPGIFKVDYLLDGPIPWSDPRVGNATTVHVVGTAEELEYAERITSRGKLAEKPFVMVCQQQVADSSRAPEGFHVVWTYAHVPHNFMEARPGQVTDLIERQISRFAPNFRDRIIDKFTSSPQDLQLQNGNIIGGDIAGGSMRGFQSLFRPGFTFNPYRLGNRIYLASSSASPGAGVHGMAGYWAAQAVVEDLLGK